MMQKEVIALLKNQGHAIGSNYQKPTFEGLEFDGLITKIDGRWKLHEYDHLGDDFDD
jgi:hypothetical protein